LQSPETLRRALAADRFYGVFLILLGLLSALAPVFEGAKLAWILSLAGLGGGCWLILDRSPRGFFAGAGWVVLCLGLGLLLVWREEVSMEQLAVMLAGGFLLLGGAEIVFGLERFRPHSAPRIALVLGGAAAAGFGVALSLALPGLPNWLAGAVLGVVFAGFGVGVLIGANRRKANGA
jgi:hypothetical protein